MSYLLSIESKSYFKKKYKEWEKNTKPYIRTSILKNLNEYKQLYKSPNPTFHENKDYEKYFTKKFQSNNLINQNYSKDHFINHLNKDCLVIPAQVHSIDIYRYFQ